MTQKTGQLLTDESRERAEQARRKAKDVQALVAEIGLDVSEERMKRIIERAEQMPESCRRNYLMACKGEATARNAIKAFCVECVGWVRTEVPRCTGWACPLWEYRPFQT